ncbi:MAG: hypothetical protein M0Z71_12090 [Nitrospiraceae bacterium]|nr:hypothetical protein [Nitrospiraceae bacterium]
MIKLSLQYYPEDIQHADNRDFKRMRLREISSGVTTLKRQIAAVEEKTSHQREIQAAEFTDTKWLSSDEKRKVLKQWTSFVKNGFSESLFTSAIYDHLHLHCGYIAHYNKHGYYGEYWGAYAGDLHRHAREDRFSVRPVPKAFYNWESFVRQFDIWGDYRDIGAAMMMVLKAELECLEGDLIKEARGHFEADAINAYQLYLAERQNIQARIESLRREAEELENGLAVLSEEDHRRDLEAKYIQLFGEGFSVDSVNPTVSQLFLI